MAADEDNDEDEGEEDEGAVPSGARTMAAPLSLPRRPIWAVCWMMAA